MIKNVQLINKSTMALLESIDVPLGTEAPDFNLEATDGENYSLSSFDDADVLVVVFMCNHCPYVQAVWGRLVDLADYFSEKGVAFVGINPNFHPDYSEETMEKMEEYYDRYDMNFPYLLDETQEVASEFGAVCTPDIFVYDQNRELVYHGRIDDNWKDESSVRDEELKQAIKLILAEEEPDPVQNPAIGCSIKWREDS